MNQVNQTLSDLFQSLRDGDQLTVRVSKPREFILEGETVTLETISLVRDGSPVLITRREAL